MRIVGALLAAVIATGGARAQVLIRTVPPGMIVASDIDAPSYEDVPPRGYGPRVYAPPTYVPPTNGPIAYAPPVLPIHEIYRIVRESGYSPLGAPQQRGAVYTVAVLDLDGEDGRLVIDARSGRIIRCMPAYRYGARGGADATAFYGPSAALPPMAVPAPAAIARASVPLPKPRAAAASPLPEKSAALTAQRAAVLPSLPPAPPAALAAAPAAAATVAPSFTPQPTQSLPASQGLE